MKRLRSAGKPDGHATVLADLISDRHTIFAMSSIYYCEVGVRRGTTAAYLLEQFPNLKATLVDPYLPYNDVGNEITESMQAAYLAEAQSILSPFRDRCTWRINELDIETLPEFDIIFIDANHDYEYVANDIEAWSQKLTPYGVLCGHDYVMDGVQRAVQEYALETHCGLTHYVRASDGEWADVWVLEE